METSFINRDLRDRSFSKQDLRGAVFEGCDLRGCDFRRAQLQGATFRQVKLGISPRKLMVYGAIALVVAALTFNAISDMVFGALGTNPQHPAWRFVLALYVSLAIAVFAVLPQRRWPPPVQGVTLLPAVTTGALLGFYYGGILADKEPQIAIISATFAGLTIGIIRLARPHATLMVSLITIIGTVAAYGITFTVVGLASAALSTGNLLPAIGWGTLSLLYFILTLKGLQTSSQTLKQAASTRFSPADLTYLTFDNPPA
ncbi:MAG: pentapeptide repeat-containing protein [Hormoscilla sp.]